MLLIRCFTTIHNSTIISVFFFFVNCAQLNGLFPECTSFFFACLPASASLHRFEWFCVCVCVAFFYYWLWGKRLAIARIETNSNDTICYHSEKRIKGKQCQMKGKRKLSKLKLEMTHNDCSISIEAITYPNQNGLLRRCQQIEWFKCYTLNILWISLEEKIRLNFLMV